MAKIGSMAKNLICAVTALTLIGNHSATPFAAAQDENPPPALERVDVDIKGLSITKVDEQDFPIPGAFRVNDRVRVEINWELADGQEFGSNKYFTFELPSYLSIEPGFYHNVATPNDYEDEPPHYGVDCEQPDENRNVVRCNPREYFDFDNSPSRWFGMLPIMAKASEEVDAEAFSVKMNDGASSFSIPFPENASGISPEEKRYPLTIQKSGEYRDNYSVNWEVGFPDEIAKKQGTTTLEVSETLSGYPHIFDYRQYNFGPLIYNPRLKVFSARKDGNQYQILNYKPVVVLTPKITFDPEPSQKVPYTGPQNAKFVFQLPENLQNDTVYYLLEYQSTTANSQWAEADSEVISTTKIGSEPDVASTVTYKKGPHKDGVPGIRVITSGAPSAKTKDYHFRFSCSEIESPAYTATITVKGDGKTVTPVVNYFGEPAFDIDTGCWIIEDRATAEIPDWNLPQFGNRIKYIQISPHGLNEVFFDYNYTQDAPVRAFPVFVKATASGSDNIDGHSYSFEYSCTKDDRVLASSSQKIRVPANASGTGVKIGEFPEGTSCTVTEDANSIAIPGTRTISPAPGAQLTQRKEVADPHTVFTFDHEYKDPAPQLQISIEATGLHNPAIVKDHKFKVEYSCEIPDGPPYPTGGYLTIVGTNKAVGVPKHFPIGTRCTITEDLDSAQVTGYTLGEVLPATVTITDDTPPVVITNPYSRQLVPVRINHKIVPPTLDTTGKTFRYFFKCTVDGQIEHHTIEVAANQETVTDQKFPIGTECTVTPDPNDNVIPNYNGAPPEPHTFRIDRPNIPTDITLTNVFVPSTPPNNNTPQPPIDDTPQPEKGQPLWWISVIAIPAVIVGLSLLFKHVIATMRKPAPAVEKPVGKKGIPKKPQPAPQPDFKTQVNDFLSGLGLPRI